MNLPGRRISGNPVHLSGTLMASEDKDDVVGTMQIDGSSASVLSILNRAEAATESQSLATSEPARPISALNQTATDPSSPQADAAQGLAGAALSASSVAVAQAAPGTTVEESDPEEAEDQEDQSVIQNAGEEEENTDATARAADDQQNAEGEDEVEDEDAQSQQPEEGPDGLTEEERQVVRELERRDAEVRRHEAAHAAVGGPYAGQPQYTYERGPNGQLYAIGGSVRIDTSPIPGNPEATAEKLEQVQRAALAPANPSPQDLRVAAEARTAAIQARAEAREEALAENRERIEGENNSGEGEGTVEGVNAPDSVATAPQSDSSGNAGDQGSNRQTGAEETAALAASDAGRSNAAAQDGNGSDPNEDQATGSANGSQPTGFDRRDDPGTGNLTERENNAGAALNADVPGTIPGSIPESVSDNSQADETAIARASQTSEPSSEQPTTRDGRAALQQALFEQERQTRTLLGQRAFEDAIRVRDEAAQAQTQAETRVEESQRGNTDAPSNRDNESSARTGAPAIAASIISGQRTDETSRPNPIFA